MKKVLAFLLVAVMLLALCACNNNGTSNASGDDSSVAGTPNEDSSTPADTDNSSEEPDDTSVEVSTDDTSDEVSDETSDGEVSTEPGVQLPADTNKYVSFGAPNTGDRITDADSVVLTGYNEDLVEGAVVLYDARYGTKTPAGLEDYAVLVADYQAKPYFGFVKSAYYAVGEASDAVSIPENGFVVVAHKLQESDVKALAAYTDEDSIYPHGIQVRELSWNATFISAAPTLDGVVDTNEYGKVVSHADIDNADWDYAQFAASEDYDIVADLYIAYDSEYLYYAVVVGMDYHYCPNASSLWSYCAIQVNTLAADPTGDYISEHYDHIVDSTAASAGICRQVAYAVTDAGVPAFESYMGGGLSGEYMVVRDEVNQTTTYEVKISWTDMGFEEAPTAGDSFGFSVSINASRDAANWTNVKMFNGGGIIGRNDWSKMATVTLK